MFNSATEFWEEAIYQHIKSLGSTLFLKSYSVGTEEDKQAVAKQFFHDVLAPILYVASNLVKEYDLDQGQGSGNQGLPEESGQGD